VSSSQALAQLSEEASANVANNTLTSPHSPPDQGDFENSIDSSSVTNYSFPFEQNQQESLLPLSNFPSSGMDFNVFMESFAKFLENLDRYHTIR
jgi:hypothetical protein